MMIMPIFIETYDSYLNLFKETETIFRVEPTSYFEKHAVHIKDVGAWAVQVDVYYTSSYETVTM